MRKKSSISRLFTLMLACMFSLALTVSALAADGPGAEAAAAQASGTSPVIVAGSGVVPASPAAEEDPVSAHRGESLGMFTTTGYCTCEKCSGGYGLTYSGTVPQANHTVSADLSIYPIGTRLMIGDIIYTVEDKGSAVKGNWIDIYYASHEEAVAHGKKTQEVFAVID